METANSMLAEIKAAQKRTQHVKAASESGTVPAVTAPASSESRGEIATAKPAVKEAPKETRKTVESGMVKVEKEVVGQKTQITTDTKYGLEDFGFLAVLGKGNFGKVMLAEEKKTGLLYAIKVLKKEFIIDNDEIDSIRSEKRVFITANRERHPFLVGLHSCFQTETRVYFVMEYISGGDLMLHIQREQFSEKRARFYACEVLLALEYFHKNNIVYR